MNLSLLSNIALIFILNESNKMHNTYVKTCDILNSSNMVHVLCVQMHKLSKYECSKK